MLFWGTLLKINVIGTITTPIIALMVRPNRATSQIQHLGVTTVKWSQIGAAVMFLSHTPSLINSGYIKICMALIMNSMNTISMMIPIAFINLL